MKHQAVDLAILAKYLLPASIIILIVLYLFFRRLVISYVALKTQVQAAEKAAQMRRIGQPPAKTEPIIVRRTDLYDQLTPQQKIVHKQAEDLAVQKNFREASKLFESINFQRKAIDLLEFNGFIEDAAQILLRMKVPYRAAIIYDRNGQFVRAAECFALDGKHDSAARSFEKAAGADYHFFKNAGQAFLTAGMTDNALEVYGKILQSQDVLKIGFGSQKYEFLAVYMANPYNAKYVLENVTSEQLAAFIESLGLRPDFVQNMSVWVLYRHDLKFFDSILFKLNGHEELAALFWSHISGPYANYLHQSLSAQPQSFRAECYAFHGLPLKNIHPALSELFLKQAQMSQNTAPIFV